ETLTKAYTAILEAADTEDDISVDISGSSSMNPTSTDWLEIMEHEEVTENQQKELETNDLRPENSTAIGVEGSGNLYNERSDDIGPSDLHGGVKISTNDIVAILYGTIGTDFIGTKPHFVRETDDKRPENPYKNNNQGPETQDNATIEQDVHMVEIDLAPDTRKGQPNIDKENSSPQNLFRQETVTGKKDVQMSESGVIPETEKIQLNPNNNKKVSSISTGLVTGTIETSTTEETTQPIVDEGFTEVSYSKKNKNKANSNRRQVLGPYKKSKTSGQ
ncbi:11394_t:CDS:2, partial [Gigaspora margarita]